MGIRDRINALLGGKPAPCPPEDPWCPVPAEAAPELKANPWKPHAKAEAAPKPAAPVEDMWRPPKAPMKVNILRTAAKLMIVLNIVLAIFFYSNVWALNAALWAYLATCTVLLGHYLSVSK